MLDPALLKNGIVQNATFGVIGAWANFFFQNFRYRGPLTLRVYLKNWFSLLQFLCIGGVIGYLFAPHGNPLKAFLAGFSALAILEQVAGGKTTQSIVEKYMDELEEDTLRKSDRSLKRTLPKKKIDIDSGAT